MAAEQSDQPEARACPTMTVLITGKAADGFKVVLMGGHIRYIDLWKIVQFFFWFGTGRGPFELRHDYNGLIVFCSRASCPSVMHA